jgi:hypothetical protein
MFFLNELIPTCWDYSSKETELPRRVKCGFYINSDVTICDHEAKWPFSVCTTKPTDVENEVSPANQDRKSQRRSQKVKVKITFFT